MKQSATTYIIFSNYTTLLNSYVNSSFDSCFTHQMQSFLIADSFTPRW